MRAHLRNSLGVGASLARLVGLAAGTCPRPLGPLGHSLSAHPHQWDRPPRCQSRLAPEDEARVDPIAPPWVARALVGALPPTKRRRMTRASYSVGPPLGMATTRKGPDLEASIAASHEGIAKQSGARCSARSLQSEALAAPLGSSISTSLLSGRSRQHSSACLSVPQRVSELIRWWLRRIVMLPQVLGHRTFRDGARPCAPIRAG